MSKVKTSVDQSPDCEQHIVSHEKGLKNTFLTALFSSFQKIIPSLISIVLALVAGAVVLLSAGFNPLQAYQAIFVGAFGDLRSFTEVLIKATPLILIGVGVIVPFFCRIYNIGIEGQFYAGAVCSTVAGIYLTGLPPVIHIIVVLLAGIAGGALWAVVAAWLKYRFGADIIVSTIMLNYIAIIGTNYLVSGPMMEDKVLGLQQSARISPSAMLPRILPPTRLHIGFIIALVLAVIMYFLVFKTSLGYAIRATGFNPNSARYAGVNVKTYTLLTMAISGGTAGLAGAVEIAGISYRLFKSISPGFGFEGIAVALLADTHPIGIIFTGILFGALRSGSEVMQMNVGIPSVLVIVFQGLVILSVVTFSFLRFRNKHKRS